MGTAKEEMGEFRGAVEFNGEKFQSNFEFYPYANEMIGLFAEIVGEVENDLLVIFGQTVSRMSRKRYDELYHKNESSDS